VPGSYPERDPPPSPLDSGGKFAVFSKMPWGPRSKYVILLEFAAE